MHTIFRCDDSSESRVRKQSSGFDDVPTELSYEAIVLAYPDRFADDVVAIARERIAREDEVLKPAADPIELERRVGELLDRSAVPFQTFRPLRPHREAESAYAGPDGHPALTLYRHRDNLLLPRQRHLNCVPLRRCTRAVRSGLPGNIAHRVL